MKRNIRLALMLCLTALSAACSVDDFVYQDTARIRLVGPKMYAVGSDSLTFSFVTSSEDVTTKTMDVRVEVMGPATSYARTAQVEVVSDKTTASSSQYELPLTITIPADSAAATLPVVLKRDASLQEKSVRLYIRTAANSDFQEGVNEENHLTLIWDDILSKPSNWADLEEFFGTYSDVKYRFMIQNSGGMAEFDTDTMTWAELQSYKIKFQNALDEYNAAHPGNPLTDENGVLVTFN